MNAKKSELSRKLLPPLAAVLTALVLLSLALPSVGTRATGLQDAARQGAQTVTARAQGSTGQDVPLAGAEGWAQATVEISGAPDDALVSYVRVKYQIARAQPSGLAVQLQTSGAEVSHTLWDGQSAEGDLLTQSTEEIAAFQGVPVNGTWSLAVQGGDAEGYIDGFSLVVYYETQMPVLQVESDGPPGTPGFLRLPEGATPASPSPDDDDTPSAEGSPVVPQHVPPGATIIKTEDFVSFNRSEPGWDVLDLSDDGYERYWDDANCDECGGDQAGWPADAGPDKVYVCSGDDYPNYMFTWMIYGPFDLSDAGDAGTEFVMWHEIEPDYDWVFFGVSDDCTNFSGIFWDDYAPCTLYNITYSDWVGDPSVCVAWVFFSDYDGTHDGPWVDDVVIWKGEPTCPTVSIDPPETFVSAGNPFAIDVAIADAVDLGAFEFDLVYDPTCVTATDATLGPFLGSTGRTVAELGPEFDTGSVTYGAYSLGANPGPNGDGVLATVTFDAGPTTCDSALQLQNVSVTDTAGDPQCVYTEDGIVHVIPGCNPDCPEDINGDGVINIQDIMLVASKWGESCPTR
ncbi:MAG: hypothetical protein JSV36_19890 [Anaerolineae bacterium]|nr:MAG: hypothetical protein JSV36_19890 [Anaerolineae bacterium]